MAVTLDSATTDIINTASMDYQKFLNALHECTAVLKVPGRKAKSFENSKLRTMFFENKEKITMDGNHYEISTSAKTDMYNLRMELYNLRQHFENSYGDRDHKNY